MTQHRKPLAHSRPVRVTLHADSELVAFGLRSMLQGHRDRVDVVDFDSLLAGTEEADLLLLDPEPAPGRWVSPRIFAGLGPAIVFYSWHPSTELDGIAAIPGVVGHVSKSASSEELVTGLEALSASQELVTAGSAELTEREAQVLLLIARGLSNEQIAEKFFISINTVKSHIRAGYSKIGVVTRAQATAWALRYYS